MKHLSLLLFFSTLAVTPLLAEQTLPTEQEVLTGVLKSQGGNATLSKIQSMRIRGHIETQEESIPFTLVRKKPNLVRLTLDYPKGSYAIAYNGHIVWSRLGGAPHKQVTIVTGENAKNFKLNAPFFGYLLEPTRYSTKINSIEWDTWNEQQILKVAISTEDSKLIEYYLDPESYQILRMVFHENANGKKIVRDSRFSDFRPTGTLTEAYHTEVITNGKPESTQTVNSFELNPGVLDTSFNPPEGTLTTKSKRD